MSHQFKRKYGKPAIVLFTLVDFGTTDLEPGIGASGTPTPPTFQDGDVRFVRIGTNGTAIASDATDNLPTTLGHGAYALELTETEMTAAWVCVRIKDQGEIIRNLDGSAFKETADPPGTVYWTGRKQWEDEHIVIETYGHTNAAHGFDLGSPWNGQH